MTTVGLTLWLWDLLAGVLYGGAVARLGHDAHPERCRAAAVLASPLAYPALVRAAESHADPEVRAAAGRLARPHAARLADLRCLWLLAGPDPEPKGFAADHALRWRLAWHLERLGVYEVGALDSWPQYVRPDRDPGAWECWCRGVMPWDWPAGALRHVKGQLRGKAGR